MSEVKIVRLENPFSPSGGKYWEAHIYENKLVIQHNSLMKKPKTINVGIEKCENRNPHLEASNRIAKKLREGYKQMSSKVVQDPAADSKPSDKKEAPSAPKKPTDPKNPYGFKEINNWF